MITETFRVIIFYQVAVDKSSYLTQALREHVAHFDPIHDESIQSSKDLAHRVDVYFSDRDIAAEYEMAVLNVLEDHEALVLSRTIPKQVNNHYCRSQEPWPETLSELEKLFERLGYQNCTDDADTFSRCLANQINCYRRHYCSGSCCDDGPNLDIGCDTTESFLVTSIQYNTRMLSSGPTGLDTLLKSTTTPDPFAHKGTGRFA